MKSIFFILSLFLLSRVSSSPADSLLDQYMKVKDALVASDDRKAHEEVVLLLRIIRESPLSKKEDLLKAVQKMEKLADLEKQRTAFAAVSLEMWKLVKQAGNLNRDVYYQYCPMKKVYWLSYEAEIRNPYYGAKMLTCGNIADRKLK